MGMGQVNLVQIIDKVILNGTGEAGNWQTDDVGRNEV